MITPPPESVRSWRDGVAAVLVKQGRVKAGDPPDHPEDLLTRRSPDGVGVLPLYTAAELPADLAGGLPGQYPYLRAGTAKAGPWLVCQQVAESTADQANTWALRELETGATALWLRVGGPAGVPADQLDDALRDVQLDLAPVMIEPGEDSLTAANAALEWAGQQRGALSLGIDPLGEVARRGSSARPGLTPSINDVAALIGGGTRVLVADGSPALEAGGTNAQQIALATAAGITYLRELAEAGVDPAVAARSIDFRFAVTDDQFSSLATLRAARLAWSKVLQTLELTGDGLGQRQHAITAYAMMTRQDPWVNMLRTTVAAFAAGAGGADLVTVRPFDVRLGRSDVLARRMARNTQSLLMMEAHLGSVGDPAGGSFYVERFTADLAEAAWALVQQIEDAGGLRDALASGLVAGWVRDAWAKQRQAIATRKQPLTGVSEFPILDQAPVLREPLPEPGPVDDDNALQQVSFAADYERLRDRAASSGTVPQLPMVQLGTIATSSVRSGFATNALGAGGFRTVPVGPIGAAGDLAEALRAAQPDDVADWPAAAGGVAVLAGRDAEYADIGEAVTDALHQAGFDHVIVAGKAGVVPNAQAGVSLGSDLITTLADVATRVIGQENS